MSIISLLLIEDDDLDAYAVERKLNKTGEYNITRARTLGEGISRLEANKFEVVLLDLNLPDVSSSQTLEVIDLAINTPVLVLSGSEDNNVIQAALVRGAQDYVIKGVTDTLLDFTISKAIKRQVLLNALREAQAKAEAANIAKHNFLLNMSHEFRTPLTAIVGFSDIVQAENLSPDQQKALQAIVRNSRHLTRLINNVIDLGKIEAGALKINPINFDIFGLIDDVNASFYFRGLEEGVKFSLINEFPLPLKIDSDDLRIKQVLFNLLGNAFKFTEEGEITLKVSYSSKLSQLIFQIKDTGPGISEENLKELFTPFFQATEDHLHTSAGAGLGLMISQNIAKALGGKIRVESTLGKGTTFFFSVPVDQHESLTFVTEQPQLKSEEKGANLFNLEKTLEGRVLIVDDVSDNRDLLSFYLRKYQGVCVMTASTGKQALELLKLHTFDLVLLDLHMPEMDGYTTLQEMRKMGSKSPVAVISASVDNETTARCHALGCSAFLGKPFEPSHLYKALLQYITTDSSRTGRASSTQQRDLENREKGPMELGKIIKRFGEGLPQRLKRLSDAALINDWSMYRDIVHQLAGAGLFGFHEIGNVASKMEQALDSNMLSELERLQEELNLLVKQVH